MAGDDALSRYCAALESGDAKTIVALFGPSGLYEFPLLGQRLVGPAEIRAGLARIFSVTETRRIALSAIESAPGATLAEGLLHAKLHRDRDPVALPLAMVVEARDGRVTRLSTYLDARPYRLWTDGPILAAAAPAARGART